MFEASPKFKIWVSDGLGAKTLHYMGPSQYQIPPDTNEFLSVVHYLTRLDFFRIDLVVFVAFTGPEVPKRR